MARRRRWGMSSSSLRVRSIQASAWFRVVSFSRYSLSSSPELLLHGIVAKMIDDVRSDEGHEGLCSVLIFRDNGRLMDKEQRSSGHKSRGEVQGLVDGRGLVADG